MEVYGDNYTPPKVIVDEYENRENLAFVLYLVSIAVHANANANVNTNANMNFNANTNINWNVTQPGLPTER